MNSNKLSNFIRTPHLNFCVFFLLSPLLLRHVFLNHHFSLLSSPPSLINDSLLELKKLKKDQLYVVNQQ
jgi:hypothetical protein